MNKLLHYMILFCFSLLIICCKKKPIENQNTEFYKKDKNVIEYKSFYSNGSIYKTGTIKNDSIKINEELEYYPTGIPKAYKFFNIVGSPTYMRIYDEQGNITDQQGCFYSYVIIEKPKFSVLDSSYVDFFVASPPKTSYKIRGINKDGKHYELPLKKTKEPYRQRMVIPGKVLGKGNYSILLQVTFIDSVKGTINSDKSEISFEIIEGGNVSNVE